MIFVQQFYQATKQEKLYVKEKITFEISPNQATAQYFFRVNGIKTNCRIGNNSFTSSTVGANALANGDVVTIQMIDSNGCTTIHLHNL